MPQALRRPTRPSRFFSSLISIFPSPPAALMADSRLLDRVVALPCRCADDARGRQGAGKGARGHQHTTQSIGTQHLTVLARPAAGAHTCDAATPKGCRWHPAAVPRTQHTWLGSGNCCSTLLHQMPRLLSGTATACWAAHAAECCVSVSSACPAMQPHALTAAFSHSTPAYMTANSRFDSVPEWSKSARWNLHTGSSIRTPCWELAGGPGQTVGRTQDGPHTPSR